MLPEDAVPDDGHERSPRDSPVPSELLNGCGIQFALRPTPVVCSCFFLRTSLSCNYINIIHLSSIIFCHIDTYSMYMHCQLTFSSWGDWLEPALHGKGATFAWSVPLNAASNQNTLFKNLLLDGFDGRIIHALIVTWTFKRPAWNKGENWSWQKFRSQPFRCLHKIISQLNHVMPGQLESKRVC